MALVQACQDARRAYRNWFDSVSGRRKGRRVGHPVLRRKHQRQSIRLTRNGFSLRGQRLYVAKVGDIRVAWSRALPSVPSSVTVIKEADGRYYASFVVERGVTPLPVCGREVGIDLGLASLIVTSTGRSSPTRGSCGLRSARWPARSGACPGRGKGPRTGPRPGTGSRCCTVRCGRPGSIMHIRSRFGWSVIIKRSMPRTCAWRGWRAPGWPGRCRMPAGRSCCG